MKKKDVKAIVGTAVSLLLICAVAAGLVALVNSVTAPKIAEADENEKTASIREILEDAETIDDLALEGAEGYIGKAADGATVGYVFVTEASGYNGRLKVMTGFTPDGKVKKISILTINDTPGLGMKAKNDDFKDQFEDTDGNLTVVKNGDPEGNEIQAITSATITSKGVVKAVNDARALFEKATGKEAAQ